MCEILSAVTNMVPLQNSESLSDSFSIYRNCIHVSFAQIGNRVIGVLIYIFVQQEYKVCGGCLFHPPSTI